MGGLSNKRVSEENGCVKRAKKRGRGGKMEGEKRAFAPFSISGFLFFIILSSDFNELGLTTNRTHIYTQCSVFYIN